MKKLILLLLILILPNFSFSFIESEFKVIKSKNTLDEKNLLLDINKASKEEMLKSGITNSMATKIIEFRKITGGFLQLKDMVRISGIGKKTYKKLEKYFKQPKNVELKVFNINKVEDKVLIYYGFSKKEIKKIKEYQNIKPIRNNMEMKKLIPETKYNKLKNLIKY